MQNNYVNAQKKNLHAAQFLLQVSFYLNKFQVYTNHSAISFVKRLREVETNSRLARWSIFLQDFQFDITQKKGIVYRY